VQPKNQRNALQESQSVVISFHQANAQTLAVQANSLRMVVTCEDRSAWEDFFSSYLERFIDLVCMRIWFASELADVLCIEVNNDDSEEVWILSAVGRDQGVLEGQLLKRPRPQRLSSDFLIQSTGEQKQDVEQLYKVFKDWLGPSFSLVDPNTAIQRLLVIRVTERALWFLRFPISLFCHWRFDEFSRYKSVEWIVSGKSFLQNASEREILQKELLDGVRLIEHAVVVINTYHKHDCTPLRAGTELVLDILSSFNEVEFGDRTICLKWYCNPSAERVKEILLDTNTSYFFADFEASEGSWMVGDGGYSSWESDLTSPRTPWIGTSQEGGCVSWTEYQGQLRHIRLMRVFHCHSIFNAFKAAADGREPADKNSIARALLNLGAQRVEGGMNEESYYDYLCALLYLFCEAEHLRFVLKLKCLERGIDFNQLLRRANEFLAFCGHDPISV